jgi:hypothetical protein
MQRVEGAVSDMGQTMEHILILLKNVDDKLDRVLPNNNNNRSTRSIMSQMNVKFSSVQEQIL